MQKTRRSGRRSGRRTRKGGDNKNVRLNNHTQFNNFMKTHLSSPNNVKKLENIAAYQSANTNSPAGMKYNSMNKALNVRRPNTIRMPIERPVLSPQGPQGFRNLQATFLAENRRHKAKQSVKTNNSRLPF